MNFLSSLIGELKKTKAFKSMVDRTAKEKLREDEKKEKQKEEKWNQKKGSNSLKPQSN